MGFDEDLAAALRAQAASAEDAVTAQTQWEAATSTARQEAAASLRAAVRALGEGFVPTVTVHRRHKGSPGFGGEKPKGRPLGDGWLLSTGHTWVLTPDAWLRRAHVLSTGGACICYADGQATQVSEELSVSRYDNPRDQIAVGDFVIPGHVGGSMGDPVTYNFGLWLARSVAGKLGS